MSIEIAFPKVDTGSAALVIPPAPQAPVATGLERLADSGPRVLSCKDLLVGDTRAAAEQEAAKMLSEMLKNTQVLSVYGTEALEGVNRLVDQLLSSKEPVDIPEVRDLMKELSRSMRGIGKKYDPNDPNVLEKYKKVKGKFLGLVRLGKTFLDEFLDDVRSMDAQFNRVTNALQGKQFELQRNISYYDQFYELNEQEITKLIYTIGVMELIRDLAASRADSITVGDASLGDRGDEQKAQLAEFVSLMETKIAAYKGRLWVAWAMSPQVRMMRSLSVGLAEKLNETIMVGIPTMKSTLVIWIKMGRAEQARQLNEAVEDIVNGSLTQFARAAATSVPAIAESIQTPSLKPQTVVAMATSIAAQADGIIAALKLGEERRAALDAAMIEGKDVIDQATGRVNQARIDHVLEVAQQATLQIATSVSAQN